MKTTWKLCGEIGACANGARLQKLVDSEVITMGGVDGIVTKPASLGLRQNLPSFGPLSESIWLIHFTNSLQL